MWDLIVSVTDHCLFYYFFYYFECNGHYRYNTKLEKELDLIFSYFSLRNIIHVYVIRH